MPRYFFNIFDGRVVHDNEGLELSGVGEARTQAIETAGAMLSENARNSWDGTEWNLYVTDEAHNTVLKVRFSAEQVRERAAPQRDEVRSVV